jgi:uncharacterized membrane protein YgcG
LAEDYDPQMTDIMIFNTNEFSRTQEENMITFTKHLDIRLNKDLPDSVLFAFSYVDTEFVANHYRVEMSGDLEQYHGAVASDIVLESFEAPRMTNLFINPDNTLWTGPVHFHSSRGWMQGSKHTARMHKQLTLRRVQNVKLLDYRPPVVTPTEVGIVENTGTPSASTVSDASYTVDTHSNLTGFVSINIPQLVLSKTYLGNQIRNLSQNLFSSYLSTIKIESMTFVREKVRTRRVSNSLGSPVIGVDMITEESVIATAVTYENAIVSENIKEINIGGDASLRHYTFTDTTTTSLDQGEYKYRLELSIIDNSQQFMNSQIETLESSYNTLVETVAFLNNPNRYDYTSQSLKSGVVTPTSTIVQVVTDYYTVYSYFNKITNQQLNSLIQTRVNSLSAGNYSIPIVETFLTEYQQLATLFSSRFKISESQSTTSGVKNNRKSSMPNLISIEREFENVVKFSDYRRSYDYLGSKTVGLTVLSRQAYKNRADQEIDRFFDTSKSLSQNDEKSISPETKSAITDFSKSKFAFFSPLNFDFDGESVSLYDLSSIDTNRLTAVFIKSERETRNQSSHYKQSAGRFTTRGATRTRPRTSQPPFTARTNRFSFTRDVPATKPRETTTVQAHIDSDNYLGDSSEFKNISDNFSLEQIQAENSQIGNMMEVISTTRINRSKNSYDTSVDNNILDTFKNSPQFSNEMLSGAPLATKALFASRTPAARNNIVSSEVDILKDPNLKAATEMLFQSVQKVQMLAGWEKDQQGINMLSKPIWIDLVEGMKNPDVNSFIEGQPDTSVRGIVCRMVYAEIPDIGVAPSQQYRIAPRDALFIISDEDVDAPPSRTLMSGFVPGENVESTTGLVFQIKYANSNIVTQNPQMGVLDGSVSTMETESSSTTGSPSTTDAPDDTSGGGYSNTETLPKDTGGFNTGGGSSSGGGY